MTIALLRIAAVAVVVGCVTCECDKGQKSVKVLTYNTGLAPPVPEYNARRDNVFDALGETDFDVACLQEVWYKRDIQAILEKLAGTTGHHFSAIHQAPDTLSDSVPDSPPCTDQEGSAVLDCAAANCTEESEISSIEEEKCLLEKCQDVIYGVTQICRTCIIVSRYGDDVQDNCMSGDSRFNTLGLLVISKQSMTDVKIVEYHGDRKVLIQRGYIQANVDNTTFVCTHLTSVFPHFYDVNMTDLYKDYEEMQRAEIGKLWEAFKSNNDHVLMGDLNTGPARNASGQPYIKGEAKGNYEYLICGLDYFSPYMHYVGQCTYCNSDNNATWEDHKEDAIVDHVLLFKHFHPNSTVSERIFIQDKGQLSDHYGVKLSMCLS